MSPRSDIPPNGDTDFDEEEEEDFVTASDDEITNQQQDLEPIQRTEEETPQRGPGRPKILHTGLAGRPRKQYNLLHQIQLVDDIETPQCVSDALNGQHAKFWQESMKQEYDALLENNTWRLVGLPPGQKAIGSK
ncbi:uncharacterized protein LOC124459878 [Drosophila willistoni]|uniref:uncharacterized protein LOC124459878 n=1 Tax=Drosophila willistoni TaxID=7260 RepID=UPI001F0827F3|nr:uncharacterized protein LOC124459878 [Drosophila willistoni]